MVLFGGVGYRGFYVTLDRVCTSRVCGELEDCNLSCAVVRAANSVCNRVRISDTATRNGDSRPDLWLAFSSSASQRRRRVTRIAESSSKQRRIRIVAHRFCSVELLRRRHRGHRIDRRSLAYRDSVYRRGDPTGCDDRRHTDHQSESCASSDLATPPAAFHFYYGGTAHALDFLGPECYDIRWYRSCRGPSASKFY